MAREVRWVVFKTIVPAIVSTWNNLKKPQTTKPAVINLNYFQPYTEYAGNVGENWSHLI